MQLKLLSTLIIFFFMDREDITIANKLLFEQRIGEAIIAYQKIIEAVLKRSDSRLIIQGMSIDGLGNIQDQKGHYQFDVASWYCKQLDEGELEPNPFEGLALCFSYKCRIFQGRLWYQQKIKSHPEVYQFWLGLANCYYNSELINQSCKIYSKATVLNERCDKGYLGLANICFYKLNDLLRGRQYALKALQYNPGNLYAKIIQACTEPTYQSKLDRLYYILQKSPQLSAKIYNQIAVVQFEKGKEDQSCDMLRKSLENQPYISPILSLANITLLNDSYAEAEALARMSLQLEGSNLLGMTTLGVALIYQKKFDEAIEWLYAALEVDQSNLLPKYYLGVVYFQQGYYQEAQNWFLQARQSGKREEIQLSLIACKWSLGFYGIAYNNLLQYSTRHPQDILIKYHLGCLQFSRKKYKQALELMRLALPKYGSQPTLLFMIGCCHLNLGAEEGAFQFIQKSVQVDEGFLEGWLALGHFKINSNELNQAIAYFQTALKLDPNNPEAQFAIGQLEHGESVKLKPEQAKRVLKQIDDKAKEADD